MVAESPVQVFRVQAADGRGPWRPGWSHTWIEGDAEVGRLTETVMDLVPAATLRALSDEFMYGCACRSINALMEWFTPLERRTLEKYGFYPVSIKADVIVAESQLQLLIGRRKPFHLGATRRVWK